MEFIIQGWSVQIVLIGSVAVLEAVRGQEQLSQELKPTESPREIAYQLIEQPCCCLKK